MAQKRRSIHAHGPSEIWDRPEAVQAISRAQAVLSSKLRRLRRELGLNQERAAERAGIHAKHLQRLEAGDANATMATLAAVATAYGVELADLFVVPPSAAGAQPFVELADAEVKPFENCVPLYALDVAAGAFGAGEVAQEPLAWVVPQGRRRPRPGMFVARVVGESMNQRIPNGAYGLFQSPVTGPRDGRVLLVQHRDIQDPDMGGAFTVKIWKSKKRRASDGSLRHTEVRLLPDSDDASYRPIVLTQSASREIRSVAELVEVLPGARSKS